MIHLYLPTDRRDLSLLKTDSIFRMAALPTATTSQTCSFCEKDFPTNRTCCPHCSRPLLFPNVTLANQPKEKVKLQARFDEANLDAAGRGCQEVVDQFTDQCRTSAAVFRANLSRLHYQLAGETDIYATYHDLEALRLRASKPDGLDFEMLRPQAEIQLLGSTKHIEKLYYACLSLDGRGLDSYGDCIVKLAEPMISHRASCFEGNTAVIYAVEHDFNEYLRSDWENRHMICTAAMGGQLNCTTNVGDFASILAAPDPNQEAENDSFIEVHVFGEMTACTLESVEFITAKARKGDEAYRNAVEDRLTAAGVGVTVA